MKIIIDLELCQGHSVCLEEAPEVFDVVDSADGSYPRVVVLQDNPPEALRKKVEAACAYCPNKVISLIED
jgi:ferredoxin